MKIPIHNSWVVRSIHLGRGEAAGTWMGERILKGALQYFIFRILDLRFLIHENFSKKLDGGKNTKRCTTNNSIQV